MLSLAHSFVTGDSTLSVVPKHTDYRQKVFLLSKMIAPLPQPLHKELLGIPITIKNSILSSILLSTSSHHPPAFAI